MELFISNGTKKNWERLGVAYYGTKLLSRANKTLSQKRVIPLEYFLKKENKNDVLLLIEKIQMLNCSIEDALYSIAVHLFYKANLFEKSHVQMLLKQYCFKKVPEIVNFPIPEGEKDLLGLLYQCLQEEGEKNKKGAYYTPLAVVEKMLKDVVLQKEETFLDPCCGSGAFLLKVKNANWKQLFGIDKDPLAVFIAKCNMILKFSDDVFEPQIYVGDYLQKEMPLSFTKFDWIITNPPWGAYMQKQPFSTKETFSSFFIKSYQQLNDSGKIHFLFPESVLNVKAHKQIREFLLCHGNLKKIQYYDDMFSGVSTKFVSILLEKSISEKEIEMEKKNQKIKIEKTEFYKTKNRVFQFHFPEDIAIVKKVQKKGNYTLCQSQWAMGIVTGNNKQKLQTEKKEGMEKIYTGKEIMPYQLKPAKFYIFYDKNTLQQTAKEEYYRKKEKLVYKFISKKLVFAYDNTGSLFLNSANILLPVIPNMSIKTVMAFLNTKLYQFLYMQLFGEVKILKGNLMELPFPVITQKQNQVLTELVDDILKGNQKQKERIEEIVYDIFDLEEKEKRYIKKCLYQK